MLYGLIGEQLSHSYSQIIHEKLADYPYRLIPLARGQLAPFLRARQFAALNVTIPYKQDVMPFCDEIDPKAAVIGAVNTLVNRNGRLVGYNTDFDGFAWALAHAGIALQGKTVLILGSGATSKTFGAVAAHLGAKEVLVAGRRAGGGVLSYPQAQQHAGVQVVLNASPAGMYPNAGVPPLLDLAAFPALEAVFDAVYNPLRTRLLLQAESLGLRTANGLGMLVAQAAFAAELFTGHAVPGSKIEDVAGSLYGELANIVLIGMPGCGKTSLGRALAGALGRPFADTDAWIEAAAGQSIPDIFAKGGEGAFRTWETRAAEDIGAHTGQVVATGGGIVTRAPSVRALQQNGALVFIDCPPGNLPAGGGRPLSKTHADVQRLYTERLPLYRAAADFTIAHHPAFDENLQALQQLCGQLLKSLWKPPAND